MNSVFHLCCRCNNLLELTKESGCRTGLLSISVAILLLLSSSLYADFEQRSFATRPEPRLCETSGISQQQGNRLKHDNSKSVQQEAVKHIVVKHYSYRVMQRYPHDVNAFTQGLVFYQENLYESTGLSGRSSLRKVDLTSGKILQQRRLENRFFAEGLSVLNNQLIQLTWKSGLAFVYNIEDLKPINKFSYDGEGWGNTVINNQLIISDGSSRLKIMDTENFKIISTINVNENQVPVQGLNEMEIVNGKIFANVWPTDCIAQIEPDSGQITGWINLAGLYPAKDRPHRAAVLNGIAYLKEKDRLFVTGKLWPYLYEIKLVENELLKPDSGKQTLYLH